MKSEIVIKPHLIYLEYENEFAILQKDPNDEGLQAVTFSHEISALDADIIEKTGIANVESFRYFNSISGAIKRLKRTTRNGE